MISKLSRSRRGIRRHWVPAALCCVAAAACVTVDPPVLPGELPSRSASPAPDAVLWRAPPEPTVALPVDLPATPLPERPIQPRRRRTPPLRGHRLDRLGGAVTVLDLPAPRMQPGSTPALQPQPRPTGRGHSAANARHVTTEPATIAAPDAAVPDQVPPTKEAARGIPASTRNATPVADAPPRSADWEAGEVFNVVSEAGKNTAWRDRADEAVGEIVEIELPGTNWIYVGREARVVFVARDVVGDATAFTLRVAPGSIDVPLEFVATDAVSGQTIEHRVLVSSSDRPTLEPAAAVATPESARSGQNSTDPPRSLSHRLQAAIADPTDPAVLSDLAAELIVALAPESDADTTVAADEGDPGDAPLDPLVVPFARVLLASDLSEPAAVLLDHPQIFDPQDDTIVFTLAEAYERNRLNLARSRSLYQLLIDRHPFSRHWDTAGARIEYLDRTFFLIR